MKGIFIDAENNEIKAIETEDSYEEIKARVGSPFTAGLILKNEDTLYVDDEGFLKAPAYFFKIEGCQELFAGDGIIFGSNDEGDTEDIKTTLDEVIGKVSFLTLDDADQIMFQTKTHFTKEEYRNIMSKTDPTFNSLKIAMTFTKNKEENK